jgi:SAM-dependent methyltransferase
MSWPDYPAYFRELADYYNNSRIPSSVMTGAAEIRAEFNRGGSWVRHCVENLQLNLAKRSVLELGCGAGRWTEFIAHTADQVVVTDPCARLLE